MKTSFENIVFNNKLDIKNKVFYISGNEETLIYKVEKHLIKMFHNSGFDQIDRAKTLNSSNNSDLFLNKNLTILEDYKALNKEGVESFLKSGNGLMVVCPNTKGDVSLKKLFEKDNKLVLILCYDLSRNQKINILNFYISSFKLKIDKDAYWYLIDKTEDKYLFFENEINKIVESKKQNYNLNDIKNILSSTMSDDFYKLFFTTLKKNSDLVEFYNASINSISDLYKLIQVSKSFFEIIAKSASLSELERNMPSYMFKDKKNFISAYNNINQKKKSEIVKLIFKTEKLIRKNGDNYFSIGNRFLLNIKKNIGSTTS